MPIPSIFFNYSYDPNLKEINLTKALLNVFESSKTNLFFNFLNDMGIKFGKSEDIKINFPSDILSCKSEVHLEEHGRIDAIIRYDTILFYIECKHGTNKFKKSQLMGYIQKLAKENAQLKILMLVANYYPSDKFLDDISDKTKDILFLPLTWDNIYNRFDQIKKELLNDDYLDFFFYLTNSRSIF
jgi:hypothetical protein